MDGHKSKKPTKAELQSIVDNLITDEQKDIIIAEHKDKTKKAHILGLVQGFEVANQMLIEYSDGHSLEEVVDFCKKNIEQKSVMESVVSGVKVTDEYDKAVEEFKEKV